LDKRLALETVTMTASPEVARLRKAGLRATASRVAVLRVVSELGGHPDVEAIATAARARIGTLSTQAAYEITRSLTDAGLLRRFQPARSAARYEARVGDNHHHAVCRECGAIEDVEHVIGLEQCATAAHTGGFQLDESEVVFWGLCGACVRAAGGST
jgi:Fur family ferric uptake transcriptional regulator